jgi:hypothetical protein
MKQERPERRRHMRKQPRGAIAASTVVPPIPLTDVEVLDVSAGGIAIKTRVPLKAGDRMSFRVPAQSLEPRLDTIGNAPILAVVLACEPIESGFYRVRCRALLGAFEAA